MRHRPSSPRVACGACGVVHRISVARTATIPRLRVA
jgi:hypothetical protein